MKVYQIEKQFVEQQEIWNHIRTYAQGDALTQPMHEVERNLFQMMMTMGLSLLKEITARHGDGKVAGGAARGGREPMPFHSIRSREYLSIFGPMTIARAYYWKEGCEGFCPLDATLNLPRGKHSYFLEQWALADVARGTYDEALTRLGDMLGLTLWKSEQMHEAANAAHDADEFYRQKPAPESEGGIICATADCKGVRMVPSEKPARAKPRTARLGKGEKTGLRKDAVVTSDFTFVPGARTPQEMTRRLMRECTDADRAADAVARAIARENGQPPPREPLNQQRAATMFGKEKAFRDLAGRIERRDPGGGKPIYILIDGEAALETGLKQTLAQRGWSGRIDGICLDIFHAMDYLFEAGTALHGEKNPAREAWVRQQTLALLQGRVGRVIGALRHILTKRGNTLKASQKKSLNKVITYFDNHRHMMRYDIFLEKGYPIATGAIEGACGSFVKARMDGSGKRWTKNGAQSILDLRAILQNHDWDTFWNFHIALEQNRLYKENAA